MRPHRASGLLLLPLLFLLPAVYAAQSSALGIERQTELVDPRDAGWFYRPERIESEKPEELLDLLGIKEGDVVADIGARAGFFSLRAAERVGRTGKVLAVNVQPEMIDGLKMMMQKFGHENIVPILGNVDDPKLAADSPRDRRRQTGRSSKRRSSGRMGPQTRQYVRRLPIRAPVTEDSSGGSRDPIRRSEPRPPPS